MSISQTLFNSTPKALFSLAKDFDNVDIIINPQKYLGPYTDQLLDFYNKLDKLTEEQWWEIRRKYLYFYDNHYSEWTKVTLNLNDAPKDQILLRFISNIDSTVAYYAVLEIISGIQSPVFLPMFE